MSTHRGLVTPVRRSGGMVATALAVAGALVATLASPATAQGDPSAQTADAPDNEVVVSFGNAAIHGSARLDTVVAMAPTPTGNGYWLADEAGEVSAHGDAASLGSVADLRREGRVGTAAVAAMVATPTGNGYWLADEIGGVFTFGDADFYGSIPGRRAAGQTIGRATVVAMAATPTGNGYWLADDHGGVFTFGDAGFHGSDSEAGWGTTAFAPHPARGYWLAKRLDLGTVDAPPSSGSGRRVVYSNSGQRVWLVNQFGRVEASWPVSGRRGVPPPGTYEVFSKSRVSTDASRTLRLDYMVRFAHGRTLAIGFHGIPIDRSGRPIQSESDLGEYRSAGCVRQRLSDAARLYHWAPVGTKVVVLP